MDEQGYCVPVYTPPHGSSHSCRYPSDSRSDSSSIQGAVQKDNQKSKNQSLEDKAIEIYIGTLLSRAHLLLFKSIRVDIECAETHFYTGKELLEEAEALCIPPRRCNLSDESIAWCYYVRGFLADINGDRRAAAENFGLATKYDIFCGTLKRPAWHKRHEGDYEEIGSLYGEISPASPRNTIYRSSEPSSENNLSPPNSRDSSKTRGSQLFEYLLEESQRSPGEIDKVMKQLREGGSLRKDKSERKKSSAETLQTLKDADSLSGKDPFIRALHADVDERKRCIRESLDRQNAAARASRASEAEARGSATPYRELAAVGDLHSGAPVQKTFRGEGF